MHLRLSVGMGVLLGAPLASAGACAPAATPAPHAATARASASAAAIPSSIAPSPTPAAPPSPPRSRATSASLGSNGPLTFEAAAADGGWVVYCQARSDSNGDGQVSVSVGPHGELTGDRMERFFAPSSRPEQRIEALAAHDRTGRWVVVQRDGTLLLVDTSTNAETDLTALAIDARNDELPFRSHRSLAFDGSGKLLAYLRRSAQTSDVVVRTLDGGDEKVIDPGPGETWRLELDHSGQSVVLSALVDDTNRDKRLTWPAPEAKQPPPCRGPVTTYPAWVGRGDVPVTKLAPSAGGKATVVAGFVTRLGNGRVLREPSGRLVLEQNGTRAELAPSQCKARVMHADATRQLLLVACTGAKGRAPLELVGVGVRVELGAAVSNWTHDRVAGPATRLVAVYPGNETALVDLEQKRLVKLQPGDAVLVTHETRALLRRDRQLLSYDVSSAEYRLLEPSLTRTEAVTNASWVAVGASVASAETGTLVGRVTGRPLALAPDGRVLVARGGDADALQLARGPLVWVTPARSEAPADAGAHDEAADPDGRGGPAEGGPP